MTKRVAVLNTDEMINKHAIKMGWTVLAAKDCKDTEVCQILDGKGVVYVIIGSLMSEYPIKTVAMNTSKVDYRVIVLQDQIDDEMKKSGIMFSTTEKIINDGPEIVWLNY